MEEPVLSEMMAYFSSDVKRINHALKVYSFSKTIAYFEHLPEDRHSCLMYASILHDIGIKNAEAKCGSAAGKYQEIEGPPVAAEILGKLNIEKSVIDRVLFLIGNHHSYKKIDGIDFQILVEADFIVNACEETLSKAAVEKMKEKLFKTTKGVQLLDRLYL